MKKHLVKHIKNSVLIFWFSVAVFLAIIISLIVKTITLVAQSSFDNTHQFIIEIKEQNQTEKIIAFNPNNNSIAVLEIYNVKNSRDIQSLQIPIDAQVNEQDISDKTPLNKILFSMIFHCRYPVCQRMNVVDAFKLYLFDRNVHPDSIQIDALTFPVSSTQLTTLLPGLFIDGELYREALSISIVNASGEPGLGTLLSQLLTNIGANVVSVTTGDQQSLTRIQSMDGNGSYVLQRLEKILHLKSQTVQKPGISDIMITIGQKHPQL